MVNRDRLAVRAPFGIFLLGGPGYGKGTQGKEVAHRIGGTHLSSGDTIGGVQRWPKEWGLDQLCAQANEYRVRNMMVPDDLVLLIFDRYFINLLSAPEPFIIEGMPRTVAQSQHMLRAINHIVGLHFPIWIVELVLPTMKATATADEGNGEIDVPTPEAEAEILKRVLNRPGRTDSTEVAHLSRMADFKSKTVPAYNVLKHSSRFAELKKPINALQSQNLITDYIVKKLGVCTRRPAMSVAQ